MILKIHAYDMNVLKDLLGKEIVSTGDEVQLTEQIKVKYEGITILLGEDFPSILSFIISFPAGVAAGVVANAIWDRIKGNKVKKISIDRTEVEFEEGKVKSLIQEKIKIEER